MKMLLTLFIVLQFPLFSFANDNESENDYDANHPCAPLAKACKLAGYSYGGWKTNSGLYHNCLYPIIQGHKNPADLEKKVTIDESTLSACRATKHPCMILQAACEKAGYVMGGADSNKGLMKNCMKPLLAGTKVADVVYNESDVKECKEQRSKRRGAKKN